jgi:hypothetical protein
MIFCLILKEQSILTLMVSLPLYNYEVSQTTLLKKLYLLSISFLQTDGMRELLESHTLEELWFLNEKLHLPVDTTTEQIMATKLTVRDDYKAVLACVWEGIITEYLQSIGRHVRQHKDNPRRMLYKHWLRGEEDFKAKDEFEHVYVPIQVRPESMEDYTNDPVTLEFLNQLKEKEGVLKEYEHSFKKKLDHRNVLNFFDSLAKLRMCEETGRTRLIHSVNEWKGKVDALQYRADKSETLWRIINGKYLHLSRKYKEELAHHDTLHTYYQNLAATNYSRLQEFKGVLSKTFLELNSTKRDLEEMTASRDQWKKDCEGNYQMLQEANKAMDDQRESMQQDFDSLNRMYEENLVSRRESENELQGEIDKLKEQMKDMKAAHREEKECYMMSIEVRTLIIIMFLYTNFPSLHDASPNYPPLFLL